MHSLFIYWHFISMIMWGTSSGIIVVPSIIYLHISNAILRGRFRRLRLRRCTMRTTRLLCKMRSWRTDWGWCRSTSTPSHQTTSSSSKTVCCATANCTCCASLVKGACCYNLLCCGGKKSSVLVFMRGWYDRMWYSTWLAVELKVC